MPVCFSLCYRFFFLSLFFLVDLFSSGVYNEKRISYFFNQEEQHEFSYGFYQRTAVCTDCDSKPFRLYKESDRLSVIRTDRSWLYSGAFQKGKCFCHTGRIRISARAGCPCRYAGRYGPPQTGKTVRSTPATAKCIPALS